MDTSPTPDLGTDALDPCSVQGPGKPLDALDGGGGTTGAGRPFGASKEDDMGRFIQIRGEPVKRPRATPDRDLPVSYLRRTREVSDMKPMSPGPDIQPMRPGLPFTEIEACRELMLAIVVQGLVDDDLDYVISPTFIHHLLYVGLDPDAALKVKIAYLRNEIDPKRIKAALYC